MTERTIEGIVLVGSTLEAIEGRLVIDDGRITAIEESSVGSSDIICPAFTNAHTHLGDSIAKDAGRGRTLTELVAPPDGLKHQLLREASEEQLVDGMTRSLRFMEAGGTGACYDFREGGIPGVDALRTSAADRRVDALAFGRDDPAVLEVADGFGASGAADADFEAERRAAREAGKPFAIHAGEVDSGDINPALDLDPDFLVHMVHAEPLHVERVADADLPVVVCPRSNLVTDVGVPPVETLADRTTVALGTDNVMLNNPSMFREMATTATLFDLADREVLAMATGNGAAILDRPDGVLDVYRPARLFVLDGESDNLAGFVDPISAIVRRASRADVKEVVLAPIDPDD